MQGDKREYILNKLFKRFPFDLRGDCNIAPPSNGIKISCIINFYGRLDLLSGMLYSLAQQKFPRELFEVVLVEDRGGTAAGKALADEFLASLPIVYAPLDKNFGLMGYSRNFGLSRSKGEYILFLDDDTVILQEDFLETLLEHFSASDDVDAVVPHGQASYQLMQGKYGYHDPYFMTSRCTAYRRKVLAELGAFVDDFIGQEDVEFVIRFLFAGRKSLNVAALDYFHPPLLVGNLRKPMAVGQSFFRLHRRYPRLVWLLVLLNCGRHAPLYLLPGRRNRELGRFGVGFLAGVIAALFKKKGYQYS